MLKEDAFPTIFAYNDNEQPSKFRASILREEAVTKKKLCDNGFKHNEFVQNFEFEINTKATQTFQSNKQMTQFPPKQNLIRPTHVTSAYNTTSNTYNVASNNLKLTTMKTWRLKVTKKPVRRLNITCLIKMKLNI